MTEIHYAQCWEDPETLTRGLGIAPEDDVVSIGSGGDNSLAILLNHPRSLTVVDYNPAQIFLVELKIRAVQTLDYDDFVGFVGARPCPERQRLYSRFRSSLSDEARGYWDQRPEVLARGIIHSGKFERYFRIFREYVLPLIHGRESVHRLLTASSLQQQQVFYDQVWNNRRWRWLFRVFFGEFILGHLGRDPSFFRYVTIDSVAEELSERTRHGLTEVRIHDNYFLEYILTGRYGNLETAHPYLRASNYPALRANVARIRLVHGSLEDYLKSLQPGTVSRFNLSDIFEYMSDDAFELALREILRVCRNDGKLGFWTLFVPRTIPPGVADRITTPSADSTVEESTSAARTFFYGGFHVWRVSRGGSKPLVRRNLHFAPSMASAVPQPYCPPGA